MKRIGIIGATGAIGSALIDVCVENNVEAYVFVRPTSNRKNHITINPLVHIIECDVLQMNSFNTCDIPKLDVFYYFAWMGTHGTDIRNDMSLQTKNIQMTIEAVNFAERLGCNTFIGSGSQAEYGRVEGVLTADIPCNPENGYGMAKLCAGQMSRVLCQKKGMRHIWCRVLSIYGPRDGYSSMVSFAIRESFAGNNPSFTKGEQLWDYLYSKDAGRAFFLMGEKGIDGKVYVLGSGNVTTLKEYISCICKNANPDVNPCFGAIPYMDKQVMHLQADISELTKDVGFEPRYSFEEGIKETVEWCRRNWNE